MNKPVRIDPEGDGALARFTAAEFLRMCDIGAFDDMKVELIGGELYRMPPPTTMHARLQANVTFALMTLLRDRSDLMVFGEVGFIVNDGTVVGPDSAVARIDPDQNRRLIPEDVLLVVEIAVTSLAKDSGVKRLAYAAAGIPEYWIVDGKGETIEVHTKPGAGGYALVETVRFGKPFATLLADGPVIID